MTVDPATLGALEFDSVKALIAPHLRTAIGARALDDLRPVEDLERARRLRREAAEALRSRREDGRPGPGHLPDPAQAIERLRPDGVVLEPDAIRRLVIVLSAADDLREGIAAKRDSVPALWEIARKIPDHRSLTSRIAGRISPEGRLEDAASPALSRLRRRIASAEEKVQSRMRGLLERAASAGWLQDEYVSVRNGRFVIPIRAEARGALPGIVHGVSSTGSTVFIEPLDTLDLNNDLVTLREEEAGEVARILSEWTGALRGTLPSVLSAVTGVGRLDLLGAITDFAHEHECGVADESAEGTILRLVNARHPLLEASLRPRGLKPVPLSIEMRATGGALVLSGPNAGGKTVALKSIGLITLMNQSGLPIPAAEAVLPHFNRIMADIGDHQSINESLSTFSARMLRVADMLVALRPPALVLLDEVGAGTDAEEAGALAVAIVDRFRRGGAAVVATTHLAALKAYAESAPAALNAAMEIDETEMKPTFILRTGAAGRSGGLDLAARVGLPVDVVEDARSRLSEGHREMRAYVDRLREATSESEVAIEEARRREARMRQLLETERSSLESERGVLRDRWRRAVDDALERIEKDREAFLAQIKDRTLQLQVRSESRRKARTLRDQLEKTIRAEAPAEVDAEKTEHPSLPPGTRVRVDSLGGQIGLIESIGPKGASVLVGGKRTRVPVDGVVPLDSGGAPRDRRRVLPAGVRYEGDKGSAPTEILLIGHTIDEAIERIDKFLDDAVLAGHREVRIVHGHGTGRLRQAVREFLKGHPHVASHHPASPEQGGEGATTARLHE